MRPPIWEDLGAHSLHPRQAREGGREHQTLIELAWKRLWLLKYEGDWPFKCFRRYDLNHNQGQMQQKESCVELLRRADCIMSEIDSTEHLARDYHQVYMSQWSIEESRESIKQAKIAREESKRTKLGK